MDTLVNKIVSEIINPLIIVLLALAFLYFVWGLFVFISNASDDTKRSEGKKHIFFGIIGLSIILGAWGILAFIDTSVSSIDQENTTSTLDIYRSNE